MNLQHSINGKRRRPTNTSNSNIIPKFSHQQQNMRSYQQMNSDRVSARRPHYVEPASWLSANDGLLDRNRQSKGGFLSKRTSNHSILTEQQLRGTQKNNKKRKAMPAPVEQEISHSSICPSHQAVESSNEFFNSFDRKDITTNKRSKEDEAFDKKK